MRTLSENTKSNNLELFEALTSGPPFKGEVGLDQFKVRQRQTGFASSRYYMVKVKGVAIEHDDKTTITMEAHGFNWMIGILWAFFCFAFVMVAITAVTTLSETALFILPIFTIQIAIIFLLPYALIRRAVKNAPREFEKEFLLLIKDYQR